MIPLSSARRRPASGASYRAAALPPPVAPRAGPALPASGASYRAAARPAVPPRPKRPQANEDPLAAALAPHKAKRPKKASLRERPVTDLGGDDDDGQGPPRRATHGGVALPGESAVFCRERPRITKEAYAYVARQRAPPQKPPQRRRAPPYRFCVFFFRRNAFFDNFFENYKITGCFRHYYIIILTYWFFNNSTGN